MKREESAIFDDIPGAELSRAGHQSRQERWRWQSILLASALHAALAGGLWFGARHVAAGDDVHATAARRRIADSAPVSHAREPASPLGDEQASPHVAVATGLRPVPVLATLPQPQPPRRLDPVAHHTADTRRKNRPAPIAVRKSNTENKSRSAARAVARAGKDKRPTALSAEHHRVQRIIGI